MSKLPRFINRDGSFNVVRNGIPRRFLTDSYHEILSLTWPRFGLFVLASYLFINLIFSAIYFSMGDGALDGIRVDSLTHHFQDCFFFSVQTLATIGYGKITPLSLSANLIVTIEALVGLFGVAVGTGLLFARFSKPISRVAFAHSAVICPFDGIPNLLIRVCNERVSQIAEARVTVSLVKDEISREGHRFRNFFDLELEQSYSPIFPSSWTISHEINEKSPFYQMNHEKLEEVRAELVVTFTGIEESINQEIHTRFSYLPNEILWNHRYVDMLSRLDDGRLVVNFSKLHLTESLNS